MTDPKVCTKCGHAYHAGAWMSLPMVGLQDDGTERLDLRTCTQPDCRTTLAMPLKDGVSVCGGCGRWLGGGEVKTAALLGVLCQDCAARSALVPRMVKGTGGMY